jgi:hypothetical protein
MEKTLSRRDDLISLGYMLTYLASGKLPFIKHNIPLIDQVPRIKAKKNQYDAKKICKQQKCMYLVDFTEKIYDLKFEEEPDYNALRWCLKKNILDKDHAPNRQFDWISKLEQGKFKQMKDLKIE